MSLPDLDPWDQARYARHLLLDEVGPSGQRRIKGGSVLCVGAGGLGSPVLLYLAAAGVGRIGIIDFDRVDESNLQRQIIHGTAWVGKSKAQSARERILDVNPHTHVDLHEVALRSHNALDILRDYDIVVDGTDNFPTRYLVNDACVLLGKPNIYGSIYKFEGQASVFNHEGGPDYRDLYPEPPPPGLVPSCAEGGVLGILPGVIGCIQATEALKLLLGRGSSLSGRLLLYDALQMRFRELKVRKDPRRAPISELIDYDQFCGVRAEEPLSTGTFERWTAADVRRRIQDGWRPFVLDVRRPQEATLDAFIWTDAVVPHEEVASFRASLPGDRDVLICCRSGNRSAKAATALREAGFEGRIVNLEGGLLAWVLQASDPDSSD